MPKIDPNICSAAFIIKCTATGKIAQGSIVECSDDEMFDLHLLQLLHQWRAEGDEIILVGDLNVHIYNDSLAHALKAEDIRLEEQVNKIFDEDVPFSHFTGLKPIASFFATQALTV